MLHDALLALVLRKDYDSITVREVIDEADVGRSTFYAHFTGKEELLRDTFRPLQAELQAAAGTDRAGPGARPGFAFSAALFRHACAHKHIYRALLGGRGGTVVVREFERILTELVRSELASSQIGPGPQVEMATRFVVATAHTVLRWSLERKPAMPPEAMDAMFRKFALGGLGDVIGQEAAG